MNGIPKEPVGDTPGREAGEEAEFESFLLDIGYNCAYHLRRPGAHVPEAPRVVPLVSLPAPVQAPEAGPRGARIAWPLLMILGMLAMTGLLVWQPLRKAFEPASPAAHAAAELDSSPYFSLRAFITLKNGATADQVRDRLGLPLLRRDHPSNPARQEWLYATSSHHNGRSTLLCVVAFDGKHVVGTQRTLLSEATFSGAPLFNAVCNTGPIRVKRGDGSSVVPGHQGSGACVLIDYWQSADINKFTRGSAPAYRIQRGSIEPREEGAVVTALSTDAPLSLPPMSVYFRGAIYALPPLSSATDVETLRADLDWLLSRLDTARETAQATPADS